MYDSIFIKLFEKANLMYIDRKLISGSLNGSGHGAWKLIGKGNNGNLSRTVNVVYLDYSGKSGLFTLFDH